MYCSDEVVLNLDLFIVTLGLFHFFLRDHYAI